jgi:hypothetical protein
MKSYSNDSLCFTNRDCSWKWSDFSMKGCNFWVRFIEFYVGDQSWAFYETDRFISYERSTKWMVIFTNSIVEQNFDEMGKNVIRRCDITKSLRPTLTLSLELRRFAYELESQNKIRFLDIAISRHSNSFHCSVYRKPTFIDLGSSFFSFCKIQNNLYPNTHLPRLSYMLWLH